MNGKAAALNGFPLPRGARLVLTYWVKMLDRIEVLDARRQFLDGQRLFIPDT